MLGGAKSPNIQSNSQNGGNAMRQFRESQLPLVPIWGSHQHTRELQMAARILDAHPQIAKLVQNDLLQGRRSDRGRQGLSGDQVLRIALLKQIHGLSYRELEFHLQDSDAFRAFVGSASKNARAISPCSPT